MQPAALAPSITPNLLRRPRRLSVTLSWATAEWLEQLAAAEGRSISNTAAFLLDTARQSAQEAST